MMTEEKAKAIEDVNRFNGILRKSGTEIREKLKNGPLAEHEKARLDNLIFLTLQGLMAMLAKFPATLATIDGNRTKSTLDTQEIVLIPRNSDNDPVKKTTNTIVSYLSLGRSIQVELREKK